MSSKIGFVGLGIMGRPMAKNLLKAGHQVTVYDIMPAGMDEVVAAGAEKGSSPKDVASRTDIIITMVPDGPEVEQAVLADNGVLAGARKGAIVVDMSSINPTVAQKVGAACEAKGVSFSTRRSVVASRRRSTARWRSWSAASRRSSTRSSRS